MDDRLLMLPLIIAIALDTILGDPRWLPHLIVGFGKMIGFGERLLNKGRGQKVKGALMTVFLIALVVFASHYLLKLTYEFHSLAYQALAAVLIFYCIAGATLIREVRMVFQAVEISLEKGREQVGRIVGRDTSSLSEHEVKTAALETLAENLSDGVIAPLFWFCLLGVEGMLAYKMINTLDSMIGYKNERYGKFGFFAAKLDDVANYIPARLTAFLMIILTSQFNSFKNVLKYAKNHLSPNSGYPEAALAVILNVRFGGPHLYFGKMVYKPYIGENERSLTINDMILATRINQKVQTYFVLLVLATLFL